MNSSTSISVTWSQEIDKPSHKYSIKDSLIKIVRRGKLYFSMLTFKKQTIYFITRDSITSTRGYVEARVVQDLHALYAIKSNWSAEDVVRLQRGITYNDNGSFKKLIEAGVFIEAFGRGDHPIVKSGNDYIEVKGTTWF